MAYRDQFIVRSYCPCTSSAAARCSAPGRDAARTSSPKSTRCSQRWIRAMWTPPSERTSSLQARRNLQATSPTAAA